MKLSHFFLSISVLAAATPVAFGAGSIAIRTDASGNFIVSINGIQAGSWSGDGTVTPDLDGTGAPNFVAGTTGGTLSVGNFFMNANDPKPYWNGTAINTGVALDITVAVTGTNASFNIGGLSAQNGGWQNFAVSNMTNVETLSVTYSFSDPIAAMRGTGNAPYLVGMRRAAGGDSFDATSTIENLTVDGIPYDDSVLTGGGGFMTLGNAAWNNNTAVGTITNNNTGDFHGITRLDIDGEGVEGPTTSTIVDGTIQEIERTYATGMTWEIERTGGSAFSNGTAFYFSFNGMQYPDSLNFIPEPSSTSLVVLALALGLGISRRRHPQPRSWS